MRKTITLISTSVLALGLSTVTMARMSGTYIEGNIGYGTVDAKAKGYSSSKSGVAGSVNAGYKFNKNVTLEGGVSIFSKTDTKLGDLTTDNYFVDAAIKGIMPFGHELAFFGKIGGAIAHTAWGSYVADVGDETYTKLVGFGGLGISYAFMPELSTSVQFTTSTKSGKEVPAMSMASIGLTYFIL